MQIALIGYGTVGQAFYRLYTERREALEKAVGEPIAFSGIAVRHIRPRAFEAPAALYTIEPKALIAQSEVDTVVEVSSDPTRSTAYLRQALLAGKRVVTANKAALADAMATLYEAAETGHGRLRFEASVAGGIPLLEALKKQAAVNTMLSLKGIINGSSNYVLDAMTQGKSVAEAMQEARQLGVLEEDPTNDLAGIDAQRKLAILATILLETGVTTKEVVRIGMQAITAEDVKACAAKHRVIKLLATFSRESALSESVQLRVMPEAVDADSFFARTGGVDNCVECTGSHIGTLRFTGPGGGGDATANAVWTDVLSVPYDKPIKRLTALPVVVENATSTYYVRSLQGAIPFTEEEAAHAVSDAFGPGTVRVRLTDRRAEALAANGMVVIRWS